MGNNDAMAQLNKILYTFHKHARSLSLVYNKEFDPLIAETRRRFKHKDVLLDHKRSPLFLNSHSNLNLLLESNNQRNESQSDKEPNTDGIEIVGKFNMNEDSDYYVPPEKPENNFEDREFLDIENEFYDPDQFRISYSVKEDCADKRCLLEEYPEIKTLVNSDLGFTLQVKKYHHSVFIIYYLMLNY